MLSNNFYIVILAIFLTTSCKAQIKESKQMHKTTSHNFTNNLIKEKSPYLLQHAHNPVNWFAWNNEAFEKAKKEDKPIFLSIGYSTCHWCHVMEHESFEDENVAKLMNETFVSIKVEEKNDPILIIFICPFAK